MIHCCHTTWKREGSRDTRHWRTPPTITRGVATLRVAFSSSSVHVEVHAVPLHGKFHPKRFSPLHATTSVSRKLHSQYEHLTAQAFLIEERPAEQLDTYRTCSSGGMLVRRPAPGRKLQVNLARYWGSRTGALTTIKREEVVLGRLVAATRGINAWGDCCQGSVVVLRTKVPRRVPGGGIVRK